MGSQIATHQQSLATCILWVFSPNCYVHGQPANGWAKKRLESGHVRREFPRMKTSEEKGLRFITRHFEDLAGNVVWP
jgi:hypothetical protein